VSGNCCQPKPFKVELTELESAPPNHSEADPKAQSESVPAGQSESGAGPQPKAQPLPKTEEECGAWPSTSTLTLANYWDHFLARCGISRNKRRTKPGLYALRNPTCGSPVFVTANYRLSFDSLRFALDGIDGYVLVLDTRGINVWCAAGKGTFGTDELVNRVKSTGLSDIVSHRLLMLPQLGAAGVSAHEVKKRSGFQVEYGPIRARDLPEYLKTHKATPEMRRVRFDLADRMILIPVELLHVVVPMLVAAAVLFAIAGPLASLGAVAAVLAGVVLFPTLLPWLPTPNFSTKGLILGALVALPFARAVLLGNPESASWFRAGCASIYVLAMTPVTAYVALNFTGSTPFTSRTGVRREIFTYIPVMAWMLGAAVVLGIVFSLIGHEHAWGR
jgi:hypothetical protein